MEDELLDDAIKQFEPMGYAEDDIRSTVQQLIEQKESAISEAPVKSYMQMVEMHDEISAVESSNDPMLIDRPAPEATLPRPAATGTICARRPCYGWISESESDSDYEEYLASRQHEVA
ncbi:hypothetical protein ACQ4PT_020112 [Festuca glaucescens]